MTLAAVWGLERCGQWGGRPLLRWRSSQGPAEWTQGWGSWAGRAGERGLGGATGRLRGQGGGKGGGGGVSAHVTVLGGWPGLHTCEGGRPWTGHGTLSLDLPRSRRQGAGSQAVAWDRILFVPAVLGPREDGGRSGPSQPLACPSSPGLSAFRWHRHHSPLRAEAGDPSICRTRGTLGDAARPRVGGYCPRGLHGDRFPPSL